MKITSIKIKDLYRIRELAVDITKPVTLFCGDNNAGKSSIRDGMRLALCGEPGRGLWMKKDHKQAVRRGGKRAMVEVRETEVTFTRTIPPSSKDSDIAPPACGMEQLIDAQRVAGMTPDDRRNFFFRLSGVKITAADIIDRAVAKGGSESLGLILNNSFPGQPYVKFSMLEKSAQTHASEARAAWCAITGRPKYGKDIAAAWESRPDDHYSAPGKATPTLRIDPVKERGRLIERKNMLEKKADTLPRWQGELDAAESIADGLREKIAALQEELEADVTSKERDVGIRFDWCCPRCAAEYPIRVYQGAAVEAAAKPEEPTNSADDLVAIQKKLGLERTELGTQERIMENASRQIREIADAQIALKEVDAAIKGLPTAKSVEAHNKKEQEKADEINANAETLAREVASDIAGAKTSEARAAHQAVEGWVAMAEILAPSGVQADLLQEAIKPLNARMGQHVAEINVIASKLGAEFWPQVRVDEDLNIQVDDIPYALLGESYQWRADALITEAVSYFLDERFIILDRLDVLAPPSREVFFRWLHATAKQYDTILLMGTFKAPPKLPSENFDVVWVQGGQTHN